MNQMSKIERLKEETKAELKLLESLPPHRTITKIKDLLKVRLSTLEEIEK